MKPVEFPKLNPDKFPAANPSSYPPPIEKISNGEELTTSIP